MGNGDGDGKHDAETGYDEDAENKKTRRQIAQAMMEMEMIKTMHWKSKFRNYDKGGLSYKFHLGQSKLCGL